MAADTTVSVSVAVGASALLADISGLLQAYPLVSFCGMGMIGGVAGWALAMDRGELDAAAARGIFCFLSRRLMLGACIGISAAVWWADGRESQGLWMMLTGLLSVDPVRGIRALWTRFLERIPKGQRDDVGR